MGLSISPRPHRTVCEPLGRFIPLSFFCFAYSGNVHVAGRFEPRRLYMAVDGVCVCVCVAPPHLFFFTFEIIACK